MDTKLKSARPELIERLHEINDLAAASAVLEWDQATYMPPGGAKARARQLATLERLAHIQATDPELGRLLDRFQAEIEQHPDDDPTLEDDRALLRLARRNYERAMRLPTAFVAELAGHTATTYSLWTKARPDNDFAAIRPNLEKTLDLSRRFAGFFPGYDHIADPLIDLSDEGMTVAAIRPLFNKLRAFLTPLVKAITDKPVADDRCLHQHFPEPLQWRFGEAVIRDFGYDFERGRQDKTHHPFMTRFAWGDVRITTRFEEHHLGGGLFSTLHEAGHALYEQGTDPAYDGLPLGEGTSAGVHESQSRLWENIVGRSRGFWRHYYPKLQAIFPDQLGQTPLETFYRAINKVKPSLIRVDADEVTYNLHVIIRFELELELLEGALTVAELPDAWRARYQEYLGVEPPDDRDGVLQDVHWYGGIVGGMFQGYTLGNIMAAQFYAAALQAHPEIPAEIEQGRFTTLLGWLQRNIYRHGSKYLTADLVQQVTGGPIQLGPYQDYLTGKYSELYGL
ncbi:MAG TPA: carboxypeptidase M32 [Caldilineaceae bacterium]|nr:carboxypeptidase M32 [Caldilineaceae bacterium]